MTHTSDVDPDIVSTDGHGINQVNHAILDVFGYQFAPRYKQLNSESKNIYGFQHPSKYQDLLIKPIRKINKKLIIQEWPNIQRIMLSLAVKSTTQSIIIRKLSSYDRKNRTKKALWEYDNIIKSIYILNYIDSMTLRQSVQKALNRGEAYHRMKRAIFLMNHGKFRVKTELEQHIWSDCTRFLANSIIFYNAFILSALQARATKNASCLPSNLRLRPGLGRSTKFRLRRSAHQHFLVSATVTVVICNKFAISSSVLPASLSKSV